MFYSLSWNSSFLHFLVIFFLQCKTQESLKIERTRLYCTLLYWTLSSNFPTYKVQAGQFLGTDSSGTSTYDLIIVVKVLCRTNHTF